MKTLDDLSALVDLSTSPSCEVASVEARLGPIRKWVGERGRVAPSDPAIAEAVIDTHDGRYLGVKVRPQEAIETTWSEIERTFGKGQPLELVLDDWSGPAPFRFDRTRDGRPAYVVLYVDREGDDARVRKLIARVPGSEA